MLSWEANSLIKHERPDLGQKAEPVEQVLNLVFPGQSTQKQTTEIVYIT